MRLDVWKTYLRQLARPTCRGSRKTVFAVSCEQLEIRTLLSTLSVNNGSDTHINNMLSLREAVTQANLDAAAGTLDTITFNANLAGHPIDLNHGQIELSGAGAGTISIDASSLSTPLVIDGDFSNRIFQVDAGVKAVLTNLVLRNGYVSNGNGGSILNSGALTLSNSLINSSGASANGSGSSAGFGGAIENLGLLTVSNVNFTSSSAAKSGGAIDNSGTLTISDSSFANGSANDGAAISNSGTLTLTNSNFTGNSASATGGAVTNTAGGKLTIHGGYFAQNHGATGGGIQNAAATTSQLDGITFSGNSVGTSGGAIDSSAGSITISNSSFDGNQAPAGGAINNNAATLTIVGSTFSNNTASVDGGAIDNSAAATLSVNNSTFANNFASGSGGGIKNNASSAAVVNSTLTSNTASNTGGGINSSSGTLMLQNTIVAGNRAFSGSGIDIQGTISSDAGHNLLGTAVNNSTNIPTAGPADVFNDAPGLTALGAFGGPTRTIGLLANSPAIGSGVLVSGLLTDQRGRPRSAAAVDIGAFQTQGTSLGLTTLSQTFNAGQPATLTLQLRDANGNPVAASAGGVNVTVASSSTGGIFLNANGNSISGSTITIPAGASSIDFEYTDTQAGKPTLTLSATAFAAVTQQETVLPAPVSNTPGPTIVVGRVLSSYTTDGIQNHLETITYTVYNEQPDALVGVLLTDTLAPGVTLVSASLLPNQNGQQVAWSLGLLQGYDHASITVTVSLPTVTPLQLDAGAQAFATLNSGAVSDSAPAATLIQGSVDANLLRSTPDANTNDPFVQEAAAKLDYNPQNIFTFLQDDIGYNSYTGSLRGARGTLWSNAGNALDVVSLGVALMRASGVPADYVQGTLTFNQAQQLILRMFPASFQTVGYIPAGTQTADPANDFDLQDETRQHYWFQFDSGNGMQDADPLLTNAQIGQSFTTSQGTFAEVPDSLRQKTEIKLRAETYSQASAAFGFGNGLSESTVLDLTFNDVDLVGHPLTIGNLVTSSSLGALIFNSSTNIYTPYLVIGDEALPDSGLPEAILGIPIQETFTNFPFGTQILTGLFLDTTLTDVAQTTKTFTQTLVDRIGYAVRQGLAPSTVSSDPNGPPIISPYDLTTLNILPSSQSPAAAKLTQDRADQAIDALASNTAPTTIQQVEVLIAIARAQLANFAATSDSEAANLASGYSTAAYFNTPRLNIFSSKIVTEDGLSRLTFSFNLAHDTIRAIAAPGQNTQAPLSFAGARGVFDSFLEGQSVPVLPGGVNLSSAVIIQQSIQQGIPLVAVSAGNISVLQTLDLPADAIARITADIQSGQSVIVPTQALTIDGTPMTAWWVVNSTTGEILSQGQDGNYQGLSELGAATLITAIITGAAFNVIVSDLLENKNFFNRPQGEQAKLLFIGGLSGILNFTFFGILGSLALAYDFSPIGPLARFDPPVSPLNVNLNIPYPTSPGATSSIQATEASTLTAGSVSGTLQAVNTSVSGNMTAAWSSTTSSSFAATSLTANGATVVDSHGVTVGTGVIGFLTPVSTNVAVSGNVQYSVMGDGNLSFYGSSETNLGVSGDWNTYSSTVTGAVTITLQTSGLQLNGVTLPAGTYTITAASAALSGSGQTSSPTFSGSTAITTSGDTVEFGPSTGTISANGNALDSTHGVTLAGYTGTINVAGNASGADAVNLTGTSIAVLSVQGAPGTVSTDQNTPVVFQTTVSTSLAGSYTLTAIAPDGWSVTIDTTGLVTATPPHGVQGGTYPIEIIARSTVNPNLVAQSTVNVTITPTAAGITLSVDSDPIYTIPFNGAQVPTAYRAVIHNTGPAADTFNLTFPNLPAGFTILKSASSVTIPAGETAIVGIYLQPSGALPAPGTPISFSVTATSAATSTITQTAMVSFTMPVINAVTVTSNPTVVSSVPGFPTTATITITNVGNVASNAVISITTSNGLAVSGSSATPINLPLGGSATQTLTLTPDASSPLNSTLIATVSVGSAGTHSLQIPVRVVVPGVQALAAASAAASQIGNSGLAGQFNNLSIALTDLVQNPTNAIDLSEALASLTSLISLISTDPILAPFAIGLTNAKTALMNAVTGQEIDTAVINLGTALTALAQAITDEAAHGFIFGLQSNIGVVQPAVPTLFNITLTNHGSATTTYDFTVSGLPAGVTATFNNPSVTLAPNAFIPNGNNTITLSVSGPSDTLIPGSFSITATAEGSPEITTSLTAQLTLRNEVVQVSGVVTNPPFTNAGGQVDVTAQIQSVVNQPRQISVTYVVKDPNGNVIFTSAAPVLASLSTTSGLTTVDLGNLNTTGFVQGVDSIVVSVHDISSSPLANATGHGILTIGLPVTANLTSSPAILPTGSPIETNTLQFNANVTLPDPLTLDSQVQTTPTADTVSLFQDATHHLAYVAGNNGIDIIDVSNPAALVNTGTFAANDIVRGGLTIGRVANIAGTNYLFVGTTLSLNANQFTLLVYSLSNPLTPTLVSTTVIPYQFLQEMLIQGTTLLVPTAGVFFFGANDITDQFGSVLSVDVSNPLAPKLLDELFNNRGAPAGGDTRQSGGVFVNGTTAYIASTTSTGGNINNGVGRVLVVDFSDPTNLTLVTEVDIPGTATALNITIQGNQALIVSSTGAGDLLGLQGNMTLSVLDITNPRSPHLTGTTLTTADKFGAGKVSALSLGNGLFAVSDAVRDGNPELLLVNASNPSSLIVTDSPRPAVVNEMAVSGNILYASGPDGLSTYTIGQIVSIPVTASVEVPNTTGVTIVDGSYSTPPAQVIHGATFDTLVFNLNLAFGNSQPAITWRSQVGNLAADEVRPVTLGGTVNFTSQSTPGSITLPATSVTGKTIVTISPTSQSTFPGGVTNYTVRLTNPTDSAVTYSVSIQSNSGTYFSQVSLNNGNSSITIEPRGTVVIPLQLMSATYTNAGANGFSVVVTDSNSTSGTMGSASADLQVSGSAVDSGPTPDSFGIVTTLTPSQAVAGQGTAANYMLRLTNTGSTDTKFLVQIDGLPNNVDTLINGLSFSTYIDVPPGESNFREIPLTLKALIGLAPGSYPFTVTTTSNNTSGETSTVQGTLNVVANGVQVALNTSSVNPGGTLQMTVFNTGTVTDTYDLTLAGAAGVVASLSSNKVTVAPGQFKSVTITTTAVNSAVAGNLDLFAVATSEANPAISDSDHAELAIPITQGLTANFSPATKVIPVPGTTSFLLLVNNTGNTEDTYVATIISTNGPVTASLNGLDGLPTQSIPEIRLPGLASGAILLNTNLTSLGHGTVTIQVRSVHSSQLVSSAIATVTTDTLTIPTVNVVGGTFAFNSQPHPASGSVTGTGGENLGMPTFTYTDSNNATSSNPPVNVGTYTVTATFPGNATYAAASGTATIVITPVAANSPPTDIALSNNTLPENQPANTVVGLLSTTDPNVGDTFTYTLVSGTGATDNEAFTINANGQLLTNAAFDFETQFVYSIRVKSTDQGGLSVEKQLTIHVTNIDEPPIIVLTPGVRTLPVHGKKQALDPHAKIVDVDTPVINVANSTVQIKVVQNAGKGDKVHLLRPVHMDLVIKGKHILYKNTIIGERVYGKKGGVPLTVHFNAAATQAGVEAVLNLITYHTKGTAGATRQLEYSLSGLASGQTSKTLKDIVLA